MDMFYVKMYLRKGSEGKNNSHIWREKDDKGNSVYKSLQQNEITYFFAFKTLLEREVQGLSVADILSTSFSSLTQEGKAMKAQTWDPFFKWRGQKLPSKAH